MNSSVGFQIIFFKILFLNHKDIKVNNVNRQCMFNVYEGFYGCILKKDVLQNTKGNFFS